MKSFFRILLPVLFLVVLHHDGYAQQRADKIQFEFKAVYYNGAAYLRWSPVNLKSFDYYKNKRFKLIRQKVRSNGQTLSDSLYVLNQLVLADSIRPLPEAAWEVFAQQSDLHGVAAAALYGESFTLDSINTQDFARMYSLNSEKELRFNLGLFAADQSMDVARKLGLGYIDNAVEANSEYAYSIELMEDSLGTIKYALLNTSHPVILPTFDTLIASTKGSQAAVSWIVGKGAENERYSSFIVERSSDQGQTFQVLNPVPLMATDKGERSPEFFYLDSLPDCNQDFVYRVAGRSYFGVTGPYSDTIHVRCRPLAITDKPAIDSVVSLVDGSIQVDWKFPTSLETKISGFRIFRAATIEGVYENITPGSQLLAKSIRTFTDESPELSNYYIVEAEDVNGYRVGSLPKLGQQVDETPPAVPVGVHGTAFKNGDVEVIWNSNQETDLGGYRIFYTTHPGKDYLPASPYLLTDTAYYFPLDMTTELEYVYVKVLSEDKRENKSNFSPVLTLPVPDVWAPVAPVVKSSQKEKKKVVIRWIPSTSRDAKLHKIERRKYGTLAWTTVATYDSLRTTLGPFLQFSDANQQYTADSVSIVFIDSTLQEKQVYEYRVVAQDEVENRSYSEYVRAEALRSYVRHPQITVNVNPTAVKGGILVTWHIPDGCTGVLNFQVYRSKDGAPFVTYKTVQCDPLIPIRPGTNNGISGNDVIVLPPNTFGFLDYELEPLKGRPDPNDPPRRGKIYSYKVQVRYDDGDTSPVTPGKSAIGPPSIE